MTGRQPIVLNALALSHRTVEKVIRAEDRVVDATCGNGGDTLFLARLVGPNGHVDAFDIQPAAIERTRQRLEEQDLTGRCSLHQDSHDRMVDLVRPGLAAVMFNLGWLPGTDHTVGTLALTTLPALRQALELIREGGVLTICIYYGKESGYAERDAVLEWVRTLDVRCFAVQKTEMPNAREAPIFICIEKI